MRLFRIDSNKKLLLQLGNILSFVATVIVNALANILPIGGKNTGELSDAIPNLFVPIGLTFSIWGVIYTLLALFSIYQAKDIYKKEKSDTLFIDRISIYFILSGLANIAWIFVWHYQLVPISLFFMLVILATLLIIFIRLDIGRTKVPLIEKLLVHVPFSVYLGWITVATIANVTAVLVVSGVDSFGIGAIIWTVLVIVVAVIITALMLYTRKDVAYSLVVIWALFGIFLKQITGELIVAITALISLFVVLALVVIIVVLHYKNKEA